MRIKVADAAVIFLRPKPDPNPKDRSMLRVALGGVVAAGLTIAAAHAQDVSCGDAYQRSLAEIERRQHAPERLSALRRHALRLYQACLTGDVHNPKTLFERLDRMRD
jgi:hypothetical protein